MTRAGTAYIDIDAKLDHFKRDLDKSMRTSAQGIESHIGGAFKRVATLGAGLIATAGVGKFLKDSVAGARESNKVAALTRNVIKSTGGVAKITEKQVSRLATKISNLTGVDDELIQSGENLLLTFTGIRNEVGKGNDVFDRATMVANDMSVALGQDMKASAIQVGKALNDPVKGIAALSKVGVSFTKDQKELVKQLVASGDTLGAQKLILKELETEFGGAGAAAATPAERLKVTWGNLQETIGNLLIPTLDRLATWLSDKIPTAVETLQGWLSDARGAFREFLGAGEWETNGSIAEQLGKIAAMSFVKAIEFVQYVVRHKDQIVVAAGAFGTFAASLYAIVKASQSISAVQSSLAIIARMVGSQGALSALSNPYVLLAAAIVAIGVGAYLAYKRFKPFRDFVDGTFHKLQQVIAPVVGWFKDLWALFQAGGIRAVLNEVGQLLVSIGTHIATLASSMLAWIGDGITKLPGLLGGWLRALASWLTGTLLPALLGLGKRVVLAIGSWFIDTALRLPGFLLKMYLAAQVWVFGTFLPKLIKWGAEITGTILGWIVNAAFNLPGELLRFMYRIQVWIYGTAIPALVKWGADLGAKLIGWIVDEIPKIPGQLKSLFDSIVNWFINDGIPALVEGGKKLGKGIWDGIVWFFKNAPGAALDFGKAIVNGVIGLLNDAIPNSIDAGLFDIDLPDNPIPEIHHDGGIIGRGARRGSNVPVIGQAGEGVLTLSTMAAITRDLFGAAPATTPAAGTTNVFNIKHAMSADQILAAQKRQERLYG